MALWSISTTVSTTLSIQLWHDPCPFVHGLELHVSLNYLVKWAACQLSQITTCSLFPSDSERQWRGAESASDSPSNYKTRGADCLMLRVGAEAADFSAQRQLKLLNHVLPNHIHEPNTPCSFPSNSNLVLSFMHNLN
jgi:hypothetical protein